MSYSIRLCDPVTKEPIDLPFGHIMIGGTYAAEYDASTGRFHPRPIREAWLSITYNYAHYYFEAAEGDFRFLILEESTLENGGIRGIYMKTGAESIPMLKDLIQRITAKYQRNGEWIFTERQIPHCYDKAGVEINPNEVFIHRQDVRFEERAEMVSEGPNTNYWFATAANAISPLHKLIAMAQLRPDGVWIGD